MKDIKCTLSKKAVFVWRARLTIILLGALFVCGGVSVFSLVFGIALTIFTLLAYVSIIVIYIPLLHESYKFTISDEKITINKGVILQKTYNLYTKKIQYIELAQSPLEKKYDLCTIVFHTAGANLSLQQIDLKYGSYLKKLQKEKEESS